MSLHSSRQGELVDKPLALTLAKFSYATTSTERAAPVNWTHLVGDSTLIALFERVRICDPSFQNSQERRLLKVRKGSNILEELDLNDLVKKVAGKAQSLQAQNLKPFAAVIVKSPCLAVRYPMQNNQVHRFQIKFSLEADYYKVLAILSDIGCPITESLSGQHQQHISRTMSSSSQVPLSPSISTINRCASVPKPVVSSVSGTRKVLCEEARTRDSTCEESTKGSFYDVDNDDSRVSIISSASSVTAGDPRPESKYLSLPHTIQHSSQGLPPNAQRTFSSDLYLPSGETDAHRSRSQPLGSITRSSPAMQNPNSLSDILPPKRALPFTKPLSKKARGSIQRTPRKLYSSSITTSSPTNPTANSLRTNYSVDLSRGKTTLSSGNRNPVNNEVEVICSPEVQGKLSSHSFSSSKTSQQSQGNNSIKHPISVNQPSSSNDNPQAPKFPNSEQPHFSADNCNNSSNFLRGTPRHAPPADNNPTPTQAQLTEPSNPTPVTGVHNTGIITASDLSAYMQTPAPERSSLVESWVCQQLQDDGFLTLCEDVEGVWRRIAFGR